MSENSVPGQDGRLDGRAPDARPSSFAEHDELVDLSDMRLTDAPGFIVFWALAVIVFLQFFTRYVLNDSLAWTEEIARYVLILVAFAGAVTVTRKGGHIFLEFLYRYAPATVGKVLAVLVETLNVFFYGYMAWVAVALALKTKTKMASAEIPKSLLYWGVAVCLAGMAVYALTWLARRLRQSPAEVVREIETQTLVE